MQKSAFEWALQVGAPDPGTKLILIVLAYLQDTKPQFPEMPSQGVVLGLEELCKLTSMSLTQLKARLKVLRMHGLVDRLVRLDAKTGARLPDLFVVNAWTQARIQNPKEGGAL